MPGRIRQSVIDEVKSRVHIADIVGDHVALKSAGVGSLKGLCPFHDERTPSFHVRPQTGYYHCFGCGESGDAITFLQQMDHVSFAEAVERLAERSGVLVEYEDGTSETQVERGKRARILAANTAAADFFVAQLGTPGAEVGRAFLGERGFNAAAATRFGVGFAPAGWESLRDHLRKGGFRDDELVAGGLVSQGDRGIYDRFRGRLVWPIRDVTGQVLGFGARRLSEDDKGPKYLNTPETLVYRKAHVLYGLDVAKREIARQRRVVVVEGYTDVMACHLAGVTTAVASCGTAFGSQHIAVVRRILGDDHASGEVIFTFDPDAAGNKAALRAFAEEKRFTAQTYVAVEESGLDPCDLRLHRGDDALQRLIDAKQPMFAFVIRHTLSLYNLDTVEGRVSALRAAAPLVADIRDSAVRPGYTRELARLLGVDLDEVQRAVKSALSRNSIAATVPAVSPSPSEPGNETPREKPVTLRDLPADPATRMEREALVAFLQYPGAIDEALLSRALQCGFRNESLARVRDGIRERLSEETKDPAWSARVIEGLPENVITLAHQLAVVPLPQTLDTDIKSYVRGLADSLIDRDLLGKKSSLLGQLQRCDPSDSERYQQLQRDLVDVERERRAHRPE